MVSDIQSSDLKFNGIFIEIKLIESMGIQCAI